jgi:hypothetical protein
MRRIYSMLTCVACILTAAATADEPGGPFQGECRTTIGMVKLNQKGDAVTGSYGASGQFPLNGKVKGNTLTFEYEEGQAKGDGRFTLDALGNAFTGGFQVRNGRSGFWNGWRPDPKTSTNKPATYAGLWLTDFGLMELTQDGTKVEGSYTLQGTSRIEGKVISHRLDFRFESFRKDRDGLILPLMARFSLEQVIPMSFPAGSVGRDNRHRASNAIHRWFRARSSTARQTTYLPILSAHRKVISPTHPRNGPRSWSSMDRT